MQRYFVLHDKLLILGDRKFRVEVGTDITDQVLEKREIKNKLNMEKTLIKCIDTLNHENDVNKAINELLKIVGETYDGDRAYIFERCEADNTVSNTYEWCKRKLCSSWIHYRRCLSVILTCGLKGSAIINPVLFIL